MKTLVVGLGNPILTDDGVGVKVAYEVEQAVQAAGRDDIDVTEASVGGLRLMEMMIGYDRAILIDAIIMQNGHKSGAMHRLTLEELRSISPTQHSASAHDTTLVTALEMGRHMGYQLPAEITIYAIEVENVLDFSDQPTTAVAMAIPRVAAAVVAELHLA